MCLVEVGLSVIGLVLLILTISQGRIQLGAGREVRGAPAYIASVLFMLVAPLIFAIGCGYGMYLAQQGREGEIEAEDARLIVVELILVAVFVIPAVLVLLLGAKPVRRKKKKKRRRVEDDYDDRPRRRRDLVDEDRDRPRRRSADEDDDDRPRRRLDPDDEDDDRPRRRRDDLDDRAR